MNITPKKPDAAAAGRRPFWHPRLAFSLLFSLGLGGLALGTAAAASAAPLPAIRATSPEFDVDVSSACIEVSRPTVHGFPAKGEPLVKVSPIDPLVSGAPGHGLFRLRVRQDAAMTQCPGGFANLFFSGMQPLQTQDQPHVARDFLVRPVCATQHDESGIYGLLCFKTRPVSEECKGGNGVFFTFFSAPRNTDYEKAYGVAVEAGESFSLMLCDDQNTDASSFTH